MTFVVAELIEAVTGFQPIASIGTAPRQARPVLRSNEHLANDLRFFRSLAQQFENRSPLFKGRSARLLKLALDTNAEAGKPVDPVQPPISATQNRMAKGRCPHVITSVEAKPVPEKVETTLKTVSRMTSKGLSALSQISR